MSMPSHARLEQIASALGLSPDEVAASEPVDLPRHWLYVDGTPDQFEVWADQVLDPAARLRLKKIAAIMIKRRQPHD